MNLALANEIIGENVFFKTLDVKQLFETLRLDVPDLIIPNGMLATVVTGARAPLLVIAACAENDERVHTAESFRIVS